MSGEKLVVVFFLPVRSGATQEEVMARLGLRDGGRLGPPPSVRVRVDRIEDHHVVQAYLLAAEFFGIREDDGRDDDLPMGQDSALPLAIAIRDAAVRAGAEVAELFTHSEQANPRSLHGRAWMVSARDPDALATEYFGFLYLDDRMVHGWTPPWPVGARDELPGGAGRSIFAGRGWARWA